MLGLTYVGVGARLYHHFKCFVSLTVGTQDAYVPTERYWYCTCSWVNLFRLGHQFVCFVGGGAFTLVSLEARLVTNGHGRLILSADTLAKLAPTTGSI